MTKQTTSASEGHQPIQGALFRRVARTLYSLRDKDPSFNFDSWFNSFKKHEAFTPKQLVMLKDLFVRYQVSYDKADFKMLMRKQVHKDQLQDLPFHALDKIIEFCSPSQVKWINDHVTRYEVRKR